MTEALSALAELERAAAEPDEATCERVWYRYFPLKDLQAATNYAISRNWLTAWRAELGPTLGMVELKEPTPEECADMAEWFKSECQACCINPQESADYGRAIFDAVKIVMWPKGGE
jgi:hypothetical protein